MYKTKQRLKIRKLLPLIAYLFLLILSKPVTQFLTSPDYQPPPSMILTAVGDLVMHMPVVNSAFCPTENTYDFRPIFSEIRENLSTADFTVGVLETSLTGEASKYSGYPRFNTPYQIADALQWAGFDLVFTAHNHSLDQGVNGIKNTLSYLESINLPATGSRRHHEQKPYYITEINGIKLAFFSYTTITNGLQPPANMKWILNILDYSKLAWEITQVRQAGVDGIIMALHTGEEYQSYPSEADQQLCHRLFELGVDIILGSHVHVIRPLQTVVIKDPFSERLKSCFIAYSLGNFLSNQRWQYSDCGLMLSLRISKNLFHPGIDIELLSCFPLWVYKSNHQYRIFQVPPPESITTVPSLSPPIRQKMLEVWSDTEKTLLRWPGSIKQMEPPFF
jgi:poly-gamma-glutamate synthesis protein (capsule biosynthesis protein)